jgi:hypothetical protein
MKLPNGDRAIVDKRKLSEYCLNLDHPRGRHKARVFGAVLGLTTDDADELRQVLLANAAPGDVRPLGADRYGERYVLDFDVAGGQRAGRIRSSWIIRHGDDVPRLITCYVLI